MLDSNNNVIATYTYGSRVNVPDYMEKDGVIYRFITDQVGSPLLIVDTTTGGVVQKLNYDAFGRVLSDSNPGFQAFGFAGGLYDTETELVRFGARDYDAYTGRWMSKDPIKFNGGDTNLFAYISGNPINAIDPTGLAYIAKRPVGNVPEWVARSVGFGLIADYFNLQLVHEQIFFEDTGVYKDSNVGFFDDEGAWNKKGKVRHDQVENLDRYWISDNRYYDDALMRRAVDNVGDGNYCLIGSNCQNWLDKVRAEYKRLGGEAKRREKVNKAVSLCR